MKQFLLKIFTCLLLLIAFNCIYFAAVDTNFRKYERKFIKAPGNINFLILGDSHAENAWKRNKDNQMYNFAFNADNITDMYYKLNFAAHKCKFKKNNTVVLEFDPHVISTLKEIKNNNRINEVIENDNLKEFLMNFFPLFFDANTELDFKGFLSLLAGEKNAGNNIVKFNKSLFTNRFDYQFSNSGESTKLLKQYQELITLIKQKGYRIIGVKYPVHPYYDSLICHTSKSLRLNNLMDTLASVNKIEVIDFSKFIRKGEYFQDQDHLNNNGSDLFIKKFNELFM